MSNLLLVVTTLFFFLQEVHLVLEKGQLPSAKIHAPVTPQCTPPHQPVPCAAPDIPPNKMAVARDYSFVTAGEVLVANPKRLQTQRFARITPHVCL